jgi:hypothetical protein
MKQDASLLFLFGTLRLSTNDAKRTVGRFNELISDNRAVFRRYFGVDLLAARSISMFPRRLRCRTPSMH